MKRYPILEVCTRIEGHAVQQQMLREYCCGFDDWRGLLERAEREGMAPLLRKHLIESEVDIPASFRRSLSLLYRRHQEQAEVRLAVLEDVLSLFQQHGLTPMLIKGAALCQTLYPDPALRPMRDMDILLSKDEVDHAQELLRQAGFKQSAAPIPPDHYHLPSLHKILGDVKVCIELHRGLYPHCPPYYPEVDFRKLQDTAQSIQVGATEVHTFSHEEILHYLYQHGFRAPLTYENYKLINAADIIGYIEMHFQEVDWKMIQEQFPLLMKALPLMHHISPWDFDRIPKGFVSRRDRRRKLQPVPFHGWPQRRMKELRQQVSLRELLKETFLPSRWNLKIYYGTGDSVWRFAKALCFDHPKNVFWWVRVYSHFVIQTNPASVNPKNSFLGSLRLIFVSACNTIRGVLNKLSSW